MDPTRQLPDDVLRAIFGKEGLTLKDKLAVRSTSSSLRKAIPEPETFRNLVQRIVDVYSVVATEWIQVEVPSTKYVLRKPKRANYRYELVKSAAVRPTPVNVPMISKLVLQLSEDAEFIQPDFWSHCICSCRYLRSPNIENIVLRLKALFEAIRAHQDYVKRSRAVVPSLTTHSRKTRGMKGGNVQSVLRVLADQLVHISKTGVTLALNFTLRKFTGIYIVNTFVYIAGHKTDATSDAIFNSLKDLDWSNSSLDYMDFEKSSFAGSDDFDVFDNIIRILHTIESLHAAAAQKEDAGPKGDKGDIGGARRPRTSRKRT